MKFGKMMIAALAVTAVAAPALARPLSLQGQSVERRALPQAALARDAQGQQRRYQQVFVVKLKGEIPTGGALPVQLFIGEERIREYAASDDGVYFKVYDRAQLKRWQGKPVRLQAPGQPPRETGVVFDAGAALE